jgi:ubiquinone/menaquinone biosynthesis C-methylase UbiE
MTIHREARAFGSAAEAYDRARPAYPDAALDWLARTLELGPGRTVLDLAAGTGKLTTGLARTRARVIAVEPSAGMLDRLRAALPEVEALEGEAEAIPLPDASADAVAVAQAFHWFATDSALAEIQRVLRPGGRLALVWNRRDLADPAQRALDAIFDAYEPDVPRHRHGTWREAMDATARFAPLDTAELRHEQLLDADGVVDRVLSTSFIAALPDAERARVADRTRCVAAEFGDPVVLPYVTELFAYVRL